MHLSIITYRQIVCSAHYVAVFVAHSSGALQADFPNWVANCQKATPYRFVYYLAATGRYFVECQTAILHCFVECQIGIGHCFVECQTAVQRYCFECLSPWNLNGININSQMYRANLYAQLGYDQKFDSDVPQKYKKWIKKQQYNMVQLIRWVLQYFSIIKKKPNIVLLDS